MRFGIKSQETNKIPGIIHN